MWRDLIFTVCLGRKCWDSFDLYKSLLPGYQGANIALCMDGLVNKYQLSFFGYQLWVICLGYTKEIKTMIFTTVLVSSYTLL